MGARIENEVDLGTAARIFSLMAPFGRGDTVGEDVLKVAAHLEVIV